MILMLPQAAALIGLDLLALILAAFALATALRVLKSWDFASAAPEQYRLEKRVYLAAVLVLFVLAIKGALLPFFVFLLDRLSSLLPGAMCAAGVVNANAYGTPLLFVRIITAIGLGLWLVMHRLDLAEKTWPFTRAKFALFVPLFGLIALEPLLGVLFLAGLDTGSVVQCCSLLYGVAQTSGTLPLGINKTALIALFATLGVLSVAAGIVRHGVLSVAVAPVFLTVALLTVIYAVSPYVYELPTHQCPYCLLQPEYHYMGYALYGALLLGVFAQLSAGVAALWLRREVKGLFWAGAGFIALFLMICALYPIGYFARNGVWL